MAPALLEAFKLGLLEVILEDGSVIFVGALVDDDAGALAGTQASYVCETRFRHYHI